MGILDGKRILVAGVTMDSSIGFATARIAQEQGATVLISNFGRALGITRRIAKRLPTAVRSLYFPDRAPGEVVRDDGAINLDLESMPFADASFDVVITTEVMEHVRHVDRAHREIARCLDPRGTYVFTVPYDPALAETWVLIDPETDEPLVHPMHMHGDPGMRDEGIKSYRVFGRDLPDRLREWGLEATWSPVDDPAIGTFGADLWLAKRRPA